MHPNDPPNLFSSKADWQAFLSEMEALRPKTRLEHHSAKGAEIDSHIKIAKLMIGESK